MFGLYMARLINILVVDCSCGGCGVGPPADIGAQHAGANIRIILMSNVKLISLPGIDRDIVDFARIINILYDKTDINLTVKYLNIAS